MLKFRFLAALTLIVTVSIIGVRLEKRELALKRAISLQHYRMDQLLEERARLRIRLHELHAAAANTEATPVSADGRPCGSFNVVGQAASLPTPQYFCTEAGSFGHETRS